MYSSTVSLVSVLAAPGIFERNDFPATWIELINKPGNKTIACTPNSIGLRTSPHLKGKSDI
jgi:hypothetical protein